MTREVRQLRVRINTERSRIHNEFTSMNSRRRKIDDTCLGIRNSWGSQKNLIRRWRVYRVRWESGSRAGWRVCPGSLSRSAKRKRRPVISPGRNEAWRPGKKRAWSFYALLAPCCTLGCRCAYTPVGIEKRAGPMGPAEVTRRKRTQREPAEKVIVRGNHGHVTAFCLKSVTKRSGFFNLERNSRARGGRA